MRSKRFCFLDYLVQFDENESQYKEKCYIFIRTEEINTHSASKGLIRNLTSKYHTQNIHSFKKKKHSKIVYNVSRKKPNILSRCE